MWHEITPHIRRWLIVLLAVPAMSATADAQFRVRVKFGEVANLTYQLDCVGNLPVNCSAGNLGELWKREFLKSDADRQKLKEWGRLRVRYSQHVRLGGPAEENSDLSLFDKIRIAGLQADSVEDYARRLDLLTTPPDRHAFERVVRHFRTRFSDWWRREAVKSGDDFARRTHALLSSPKITAPVRQFYHFYGPDLPADYEVIFNLIYIPGLVDEPSSAQQLQNYSLMEFKAKERPAQRIDVAVHELCHFFYDNMPAERLAGLRAGFYAEKRAAAIPAYNLLNEALAAAFGNGMIARRVTPPREFDKYAASKLSFYNNDAVDRAAKAILPWLDGWLESRKTLHDAEFVGQYISVLEGAFGDDLLKPKLYLSEMFLFVDNKYGVSLRRDVRRILGATSLYASEGSLADDPLAGYKSRPHLSGVLIVHPDSVADLTRHKIISDSQAKQIRVEFEAKQSALFGAARGPSAHVYIVVAGDAEGVKKLVEQLADAGQFQGIYQHERLMR